MKLEEAKKEVTRLRPMYHDEINALLDEVYDDHNAEIEKLKKWVNQLLEKDRQRVAWREQVQRNLPKYTFEKMKKRIEVA